MSDGKRLIEARLRTLHEAITVLRALAPEMSAHRLRLESGEKMLRRIATDYEDQCNRLAELASAERKPPQRVTTPGRRKRSQPRSLIIECVRCGSPEGSNPDCPRCKPQKRRCSCGPFDTCALCRDESMDR